MSRLSVECTRTASPASRAATSLLQFGLVRILARAVRVQLNVLIAAALACCRRIGRRARFDANIAGFLLNRCATAAAANARRTCRRRTGRGGGRRAVINRTARISATGDVLHTSGHRGHAQYSRIAHAIAAGDGWLRHQTEYAYLAHIAVAIAHPHIVLGAQGRRGARELQTGPCFPNRNRRNKLWNRMVVVHGRQLLLGIVECFLPLGAFFGLLKDGGHVLLLIIAEKKHGKIAN